MAQLVLDDPSLRDMLYRFVKDYAEAQHAIEITNVAGSGAFELILTIILAAVTGGAGVIAAVGSKTVLIRKFQKVGDLLSEFAKASRRMKLKAREHKAKSRPADFKDLESTETLVKKTDARGAEAGITSSEATTSYSEESTLYRRDSRPPEIIFKEGFQPRQPHADVPIEDYVDFNVPSQYVGTSKIKAGATEVNTQTNQSGYLYEITDPGGGIDVNDVYPKNPFAHEQEIAFPGGIDTCSIKGCTPLNSDNNATGEFVPNPNYTRR